MFKISVISLIAVQSFSVFALTRFIGPTQMVVDELEALPAPGDRFGWQMVYYKRIQKVTPILKEITAEKIKLLEIENQLSDEALKSQTLSETIQLANRAARVRYDIYNLVDEVRLHIRGDLPKGFDSKQETNLAKLITFALDNETFDNYPSQRENFLAELKGVLEILNHIHQSLALADDLHDSGIAAEIIPEESLE